jgi:hypothetical protein
MPFRFRRSIRIAPGVRLNLGRRGVSTSVGGRGGHVSVGTRGVRATATLPGTGVSYTAAGLPTAGKRSRRSPHVTWGQRLIGAAVVLGTFWWFGWL